MFENLNTHVEISSIVATIFDISPYTRPRCYSATPPPPPSPPPTSGTTPWCPLSADVGWTEGRSNRGPPGNVGGSSYPPGLKFHNKFAFAFCSIAKTREYL